VRWQRAGERHPGYERLAPVSFRAPVHFVGISGIGMSALARVLHARGLEVSGSSDRQTELTDRLEREGIRVAVGHTAANLGDARTVVVSSAIAPDNAELGAARERGIALVRRGSLLAGLMAGSRGIAVAGTHGKTTTTAMLGGILEAAGWDPTVVVGGELGDGSNARSGAGQWFVAESDESDGSFLEMRPQIAVVTNIENDHVSCDDELEQLVSGFETFLDRLEESAVAVVGIDEPRCARLATRPRAARTVTVGFTASADYSVRNVHYAGFGSRFEFVRSGVALGSVDLSVPGAINVSNACAAAAAALEAGAQFSDVAEALGAFRGVRRRFEVLVRAERMTVVDDYAHHPTAVEATIAAARADWTRDVVVVFQPHRYSRTAYLAREFALALRGADSVVLTDVYSASEAPLPGVDASLIGEPLREAGTEVTYVASVDDLPNYLLEFAAPGALVLALGAGNISGAAHRLAELVRADAGSPRA
jgi:UDP-N-acetylmuramate--alanine ligase